ncbi:hypothetical protein A9404_11180 [Halothiobacillus diazotrophicus]|uniref:UPF0276 protein A9404_11180 n=1 Tax=Halothiobacillus diazotrophicus TaxID=1860122 RepID=A0A191ZJ51_9GAMM|nr:DUF692 domain-containing protein [Halothiobacillus diazotrophicus]ANJ67868.1 hypothetical protein A9404_11180 [Halothiobacillus diazotrophicus]
MTVPRLPPQSGIGLKPEHFQEIVDTAPPVGFFEIHAENYLMPGGAFHHFLTRIRADYPLSVHGVGLSIGGAGPLDRRHLSALRGLLDRYEPEQFSEHLAWSSHNDVYLNDLLPMPYDRATLDRVCAHIDEVQTMLGRQMLLENPATYVAFAQSTMSESAFLGEIVRRTGCGLLLDVNNVYVSCCNHGRDPLVYLAEVLAAVPGASVGEIHLAGFHRDTDSLGAPLLIDSHGRRVDDAVWALFAQAMTQLGPKPVLIEWDSDLPPLGTLLVEARRAAAVLDRVRPGPFDSTQAGDVASMPSWLSEFDAMAAGLANPGWIRSGRGRGGAAG